MRQPHSILNCEWSILQFIELRMVRPAVYRIANDTSSSKKSGCDNMFMMTLWLDLWSRTRFLYLIAFN